MTQQSQPVTPTGPAPAAAQPQLKEHVVVAGESLEQIAAKYGVSADALRRANNLTTQPAQAGQKLKIPAVAPAAPPGAAPFTGVRPAGGTPKRKR